MLSIDVSADGRLLASGEHTGVLRVWDLKSGQEIHGSLAHPGALPSVTFSPDGTRLASCDWDKMVRLWEVPSCSILKSLDNSRGVTSVVNKLGENKTLFGGSLWMNAVTSSWVEGTDPVLDRWRRR